MLLPVQHALAAAGRIIMAGRDIGTVVLPDADLKVYLDVSIAERARRRAAERGVGDDPARRRPDRGGAAPARRHRLDARGGPLRKPDDAILINTDGNTLEQTIDEVVDAIRAKEAEMGSETRVSRRAIAHAHSPESSRGSSCAPWLASASRSRASCPRTGR